jgi:hypothetical protein
LLSGTLSFLLLKTPSDNITIIPAVDLRVDVAVPQVVDGAPGAAKQQRARPEQRQRGRIRRCAGGRGQRDGPETRPGQQPGACRIVENKARVTAVARTDGAALSSQEHSSCFAAADMKQGSLS